MRKIIVMVLSLVIALCMAACSDIDVSESESNSAEKTYYTVTFVQNGQPDVVKTVEEGENLTDIPSVKSETGYTVVWEAKTLTNIQANITVNALRTANSYTVTYDANSGSVAAVTQTIVYDSEYVLETPTRNDYTFICWKNGQVSVTLTGVWKIAEDVTLTAEWQENIPENYYISFVQEGYDTIVKTVAIGETIANADIPTPISEIGYDVVWDVTDFSAITSSTTVNAVKTAKSFVIHYELGSVSGDSHAQISATSQNVKYDEAFNLLTPSCDGYIFKGWVIKDTETTFENGKYTLTDNVTLVAVWEEDTNDDRWWTKNY